MNGGNDMKCKHKECQFSRPIVANTTIRMCYYILDNGKSRDCEADVCNHWQDAPVERKRSKTIIMPNRDKLDAMRREELDCHFYDIR